MSLEEKTREKGPCERAMAGVGAWAGTGVGAGVEGVVVEKIGTRLMVLRRWLGEDTFGVLPSVVVVTVVETMTAPKSSAPGTGL